MPDAPQMKPQDTTIFLLGEIKGTLGALQSSVASNTQAQAEENSENKREHEEFRTKLTEHGDAITALRVGQPVKTPWFSVVGGVSGIGAIVLSAITLINLVSK